MKLQAGFGKQKQKKKGGVVISKGDIILHISYHSMYHSSSCSSKGLLVW